MGTPKGEKTWGKRRPAACEPPLQATTSANERERRDRAADGARFLGSLSSGKLFWSESVKTVMGHGQPRAMLVRGSGTNEEARAAFALLRRGAGSPIGSLWVRGMVGWVGA